MFASRKKWHACLLPSALALTVAVAPMAMPRAFAQNSALSEARSHYNKGSELFAKGDYQAAIGEFATADKLSHSPLLQYNIALCYDRLGSHAEALRRYRRYLKEAPNSSNRSSVESKINRLEGVLRSAAAEKRASDEQRIAQERAAAAAAAKASGVPAVDSGTSGAPTPYTGPDTGPDTGTSDVEALAASPVYTPEAATSPATGSYTGQYTGSDPGLVRVSAIDVAAIGKRRNMASSPNATQPGDPNSSNPNALVPPEGDAAKDDAFYKQWWFWVVAGVGVVVLINIASTDNGSQDQPTRSLLLPMSSGSSFGPAPGGLQWRF